VHGSSPGLLVKGIAKLQELVVQPHVSLAPKLLHLQGIEHRLQVPEQEAPLPWHSVAGALDLVGGSRLSNLKDNLNQPPLRHGIVTTHHNTAARPFETELNGTIGMLPFEYLHLELVVKHDRVVVAVDLRRENVAIFVVGGIPRSTTKLAQNSFIGEQIRDVVLRLAARAQV
jgi:hypothetical protein